MITVFNRCILAVLLVCCSARVASAEINIAPSLEWLTCSAEAIVQGKIKELKESKGPGDVTYEDCVLAVERIYKGDLKDKEVSFTLRRLGESPTAVPLAKSKEGVLVFLGKSKDHGPEGHLDGKWVPTRHGVGPALFDLSRPLEHAYSKEMKIVRDPKELTHIVGLWAMSPVKRSLHIDVPADSPVYEKLYAGSACFLIVPAEEKFREQFMKLARSENPYERAKAAGELAKYPGDETEAVLRSLLADDALSFSYFAADQIHAVHYHVRAAAHQSLVALGKAAPHVLLERKPTDEEQSKLRKAYWEGVFGTALKAPGERWTVLSVADGMSRRIAEREQTIVVVTCSRDKQKATFTLIPKEWPADALPGKGYLGTNGPSSQGARRFYLEGDLPEDVQRQVVRYCDLEK